MKKSIMPSLLTGGGVIALAAALVVAMVFICLGDDLDYLQKDNDQQGMPHIIMPDAESAEETSPAFDFNDTKGFVKVEYGSCTFFRSEDSLRAIVQLKLTELYGSTVTVKDIRYQVYNQGKCVHSGYVDLAAALKSKIISGGSVAQMDHTAEVYGIGMAGDISIVYIVTWQDADGNEGVGSCRHDFVER